MAEFKQVGGARLGNFNATFPFATLSGDSDGLHLSCFGWRYHFARADILGLRRHRGLFSTGLRIEHSQDSVPELVVFWTFGFLGSSAYQNLCSQLERLGYEIRA
jgi:hypothetical protein